MILGGVRRVKRALVRTALHDRGPRRSSRRAGMPRPSAVSARRRSARQLGSKTSPTTVSRPSRGFALCPSLSAALAALSFESRLEFGRFRRPIYRREQRRACVVMRHRSSSIRSRVFCRRAGVAVDSGVSKPHAGVLLAELRRRVLRLISLVALSTMGDPSCASFRPRRFCRHPGRECARPFLSCAAALGFAGGVPTVDGTTGEGSCSAVRVPLWRWSLSSRLRRRRRDNGRLQLLAITLCFNPGQVFSNLQTASLPANSYAVPSDGVLTAWAYQASTPTPAVKLIVARATANADRVSRRRAERHRDDGCRQLNTYANIAIAVKAGDVLGRRISINCAVNVSSGPGYTERYSTADPPTGGTFDFLPLATFQGFINISARLEADGDGDGRGDETQDGCPTGAAAGPTRTAMAARTPRTLAPRARQPESISTATAVRTPRTPTTTATPSPTQQMPAPSGAGFRAGHRRRRLQEHRRLRRRRRRHH